MGNLAKELQSNIENKEFANNVDKYKQHLEDGLKATEEKKPIYDFKDWQALHTVTEGALATGKLAVHDHNAMQNGLETSTKKMGEAAMADIKSAIELLRAGDPTMKPASEELRNLRATKFIADYAEAAHDATQMKLSPSEFAEKIDQFSEKAPQYNNLQLRDLQQQNVANKGPEM